MRILQSSRKRRRCNIVEPHKPHAEARNRMRELSRPYPLVTFFIRCQNACSGEIGRATTLSGGIFDEVVDAVWIEVSNVQKQVGTIAQALSMGRKTKRIIHPTG